MNEWHALREASKEPCSAVPWRSHTAYGRNLSGVYTDLPMPRGTQCLLREPTRNGQSMWTELSFLSQTFLSLWPFHNSLGIRSANLIYGNPLQYSCLGNPMDGRAWWAVVHGVARSRTRLSDFTFTFHFHALEKETATHPTGLAWRIPGTGEPGGLPSMGLHRVWHDWSDLAAAAAARE